ncbi:MAG TPA: MBL fold metallo-hydrolase [Steroidobacteraceae bacterium]|nr:MBL fold metallo-hydrolase [Steroidobacteraceae bacterium]
MRMDFPLAVTIAVSALTAMPRLAVSAPPLPHAPKNASDGARPANAGVTRIILLGTDGGPRAYAARAEPGNILAVDGTSYLIDAGPGVERQIALAGFKLGGIRTIFITHHHIDHDGGLPALMAMTWFDAAWDDQTPPPVQIYGPPATQFLARAALDYLSVSERIFRAGVPALPPAAASFQAHDIHGNGELYRDGRVTVTAVENTHFHFKSGSPATGQDMSFSYRFDTSHGSVVFTGDTGPSQAVTKLARNAAVLVSEVCLCDSPASVHPTDTSAAGKRAAAAMDKEEDLHMRNEHLTPEDVGRLAAAAHVKVVILTHFVPGDGKADPSRFTAGVMKYFSGPVIPGKDLLEYDIR